MCIRDRKYFLSEYNSYLGGDVPSEVPWIEHVLPQSPVDEWYESFTKEQVTKYKHVLGNLLPLSEKMNQELSNKVYAEKKIKFAEDSMFKSARSFAEKYSDWTPEKIEERGKVFAAWAVQRWVGPALSK